MVESTFKLNVFAVIALLLVTMLPSIANSKPIVGIAQLEYKIPSVGSGISQLISNELAARGRFDILEGERLNGLLGRRKVDPQTWYSTNIKRLSRLNEGIDLLLVGKVIVFDVYDKDSLPDWSNSLSDLGSLLGGNSEVAHVAFDVSLIDITSGEEVFSVYCEGFESKKGVRTGTVTYGWAAKTNFAGDGFRETQLGRATYKALGVLLEGVYSDYPLEGRIVGVADDAIVINLGKDSGLQPGDELALFRRREITSSAGEVVWVSEDRLGSARVLEFQNGRCLCLLLDGFGMVLEGDLAIPLVESYLLPIEAD